MLGWAHAPKVLLITLPLLSSTSVTTSTSASFLTRFLRRLLLLDAVLVPDYNKLPYAIPGCYNNMSRHDIDPTPSRMEQKYQSSQK